MRSAEKLVPKWVAESAVMTYTPPSLLVRATTKGRRCTKRRSAARHSFRNYFRRRVLVHVPVDRNNRRPSDDPRSAMTPLISAYVVYACLLGLTTALAALCASQRARQWFFAQVWASGGGASRVDAKLRDAKRTLLRGIAGRVLDVGSGEGVNLQYGSMVKVTAHCPSDLLGPTARAPGCATHSARATAPLRAQGRAQCGLRGLRKVADLTEVVSKLKVIIREFFC